MCMIQIKNEVLPVTSSCQERTDQSLMGLLDTVHDIENASSTGYMTARA